MVEPTPWPKTPPPGAPRAVDLIADVLHDAFKGDTDVDLDLLAADVVDTLQGRALTVELRWYDGDEIRSDGVVVLGRTEQEMRGWHTGRSWAGHAKEDSCPCPKAPCGLADGYTPGCPEHDPTATKTIRQRHRAEDCPGAADQDEPPTDWPSITCPVCGRTSYNPNDVANGYCGACHDWTSKPAEAIEQNEGATEQ